MYQNSSTTEEQDNVSIKILLLSTSRSSHAQLNSRRLHEITSGESNIVF